MKKLYSFFNIIVAVFLISAVTIQAQTKVSQWGSTPRGSAWPILNTATTPAGNAGMGADAKPAAWASILGGFPTLTATTSQAFVITGTFEFVGGGGGSAYTWLRYALTYQDTSARLSNQNTPTAAWTGVNHSGYQFNPRTGNGTISNSTNGTGTLWTVPNSGGWNSGYSGGKPFSTVYNQPARAVATAGVYDWAMSVQPLGDGTNEVRWYFVKQHAAGQQTDYWFAGTAIDVSQVTTKFNAVGFSVNNDIDATCKQVNLTNVTVSLGSPITIPDAPWQAYYVDQWGFLGGRQGNWKFIPDPEAVVGNAGIGGDASLSVEWGAIRGQFVEPVTATTSKAIIVTGNIEFQGAGIDVWSGLRYGLFMHDAAGTLITTNVDSTRWSGSESSSHGYMFSPISGTQRATDGVSGGLGTQWIRVSGNYISTSNGSGPIYLGGLSNQLPSRAVADAGKYAFAISVQPLANGTKQVRFYLIKGDVAQSAKSTYYFAGEFIDTTKMAATFNGVVFAAHATGSGANPDLRGMKLTDVKVDVGTSFELPEAPWEAFYISDWGLQGNRTGGYTNGKPNWKLVPNDVIGNSGIASTKVPQGQWATIRGGFQIPVTATTKKALIVTGVVEFVGAGPITWSGLRYGLFRQDAAGTVQYAGTDTARWGTITNGVFAWGSENSYGYMFTPQSGTAYTGNIPSGTNASQGIYTGGSWVSTFGGAVGFGGMIQQAPARAVFDAGKYNFAFSVQPLADGTNEVRFYMIKQAAPGKQTTYWYGGTLIDPLGTTKTFNGVCFGLDPNYDQTTSPISAMNLTDVKVDIGTPITVPRPPWQAYYVDQWGFYGGRIANWKFTPGEVIGNATISGTAQLPSDQWTYVRAGFIEPTAGINKDTALVVTGKMEFVGGGFSAANSLYLSLLYNANPGKIVSTNVDSTHWDGIDSHNFGYLLIPRSGNAASYDWTVGHGNVGAVSDRAWTSINGDKNYVLGDISQTTKNAIAGAGVYNFAISVAPQTNGSSELRFKINNADNSYVWQANIKDTHNPLVTQKFNGLAFAFGGGNTTTAIKITDVQVDLANPSLIPVSVEAPDALSTLPTDYALNQNYPNPFNPTTTIEFALPKTGNVKLVVYDALGRIVSKLVDEQLSAGHHKINFNASNLASGIYFYRLEAGDFAGVKKLILLK